MTSPKEECRLCMYYLNQYPNREAANWDKGQCRHNSPTLPLVITIGNNYPSKTIGEFPYTLATDWCGDFSRKSNETN